MLDEKILNQVQEDDDKFTGLIRVHYLADPMAGSGDAGTLGYLRVEPDDFKIKKIQRAPEVGGYFYSYDLNGKGVEKIENAFNLKEIMLVGWGFRDVNALEEEKESLRERIRRDKKRLAQLEKCLFL